MLRLVRGSSTALRNLCLLGGRFNVHFHTGPGCVYQRAVVERAKAAHVLPYLGPRKTRRCFATDATGDAATDPDEVAYKSIREVLRSFIKDVHPDRFAQTPEKQAVNERSLAELNAFLDSVDNRTPLPKSIISLEFYVRAPAATAPTSRAGTARKLVFRLNLEEERKYRRYLMHTLPFATDCLRGLLERSGHLERPLREDAEEFGRGADSRVLRTEYVRSHYFGYKLSRHRMEKAFARDLPRLHLRDLGTKGKPPQVQRRRPRRR